MFSSESHDTSTSAESPTATRTVAATAAATNEPTTISNDAKVQLRLRKHQCLQKQIMNPKYCGDNRQRIVAALKDSFWEYTRKTKVSGVWLLRPKRTQGIARWIWSAVLFSLFMLAIFLSLKLWLKFYSYPILNTISNDLLITDVAFPGVTICSPIVVNKERVRRYLRTLKIPPQYKLSQVAEGFEYINAFTDQNWVPPTHSSYKATDAVLRANNVSIYDAALHISAGCDDFVRFCFWGTTRFPCRQNHEYLSFIPTTSYLGPCCSFNYNPRNLSYVPFSANIFGMDGGLTFIGVEGSERNMSTGLIVLVHHPMDFVTEAASSVTITTNSESFVEIAPTVQSSSTDVLELSQRKRDCLTSNELELRTYRQASCTLACQTEVIYKKCKCYPYHLPVTKKEYRECTLKDTACFSQFYDDFKSVKCDQCLPNCYDVTYSTLAYKTDLLLHNYSVSPFYAEKNLTTSTFIVRVYLAKQAVPSIRKVTVMSWIGLLSDLGGVFNLCLGLSVISLVEFLYFFIYRFYNNYRTRSVLIQPHGVK